MKNLLAAVTVLAVSTAQAATIHVDIANCPGPGNGSEADPYCSIQTAIDTAVDTDEIVVAPGTYFEAINFLGKAVTLRSSDGVDVTTIDGNGAPHVVQCVSGEGPDTVLDGFTITGGNADGGYPDNAGGGMFTFGSSPTVTNCIFTGNAADFGGGMYMDLGSPMVSHCTFSGNEALSGGGMEHSSFASSTVTNCTFSENSAGFGGGIRNSGSGLTLTNCTFSGNSATNGHALAFDSNPQSPSDLMMTNCILREGGDEIWNNDGSTINITYTNVQDGFPGTGNIDADPMFVDPDHGDFRLSPGSPCIDAGHNNAISDLADTDKDGNPRFADDPATDDTGCGVPVVVDMGAYEYQGDPFPVKYGDVDGDGIVDMVDFLALLNDWGPCTQDCCLADFDLDANVGIIDFLILLGNWTA